MKKKINIGVIILIIGFLLYSVGVILYSFNIINTRDTPSIDTDSKTSDEVDLDEVGQTITDKLGNFLLYNYDGLKESGIDLLNDSSKRLKLVYSLLELDGNVNTTDDDVPINYVSIDKFKKKYEELFGSLDNYDNDILNGYTHPSNLEDKYIGWVTLEDVVGIVRSYTCTDVSYDKDNYLYTINGAYSDNQLGSETATGTFTIVYKDNYLIGITLEEDKWSSH